jgi:diguanylate cyclase (GGDEF)-like protein
MLVSRTKALSGDEISRRRAHVMVTNSAYESLMQFLYRAPIGLVETTITGDITMINPMSANLLMPLSRDGSLDNLFTALQDVAPQLRQMAAAVDPPSGVVCESLRIPVDPAASGGAAPQILSLNVVKLDEDRLMAVVTDVTLEVQREQQGLSRKLGALARIDKLTQMPNRTAVLERLKAVMARTTVDAGYEFALLYMNCDRLKLINDSLGHAVGDDMLKLLADRLRTTLRSHDRNGHAEVGVPVAARIGGDEFVVLLDNLRPPDDVCAVAQRIVDELTRPYTIGTHKVYCSVSMGIVLRDSAQGDADAVLQDASLAMEEAKRAGGARYVLFERGMDLRAKLRAGLEADLRLALTEGQLFVMYQPVVGLQGPRGAGDAVDRSVGVEALVRWHHPLRGVVQPIEFISVAEESGMIDALGEFVLRTACREFVLWHAKLGPRAPRSLAVNLSRGQLGQPGLVAMVQGILRSSGMPAARLQLEVTESLAAQGVAAQARLNELKALGLTLALDDFGTGYSSLSSLHEIPVDVVKIDQSFVSQADTSLHHRVLIDATIRVAHSLGMTTVAEGIETVAQVEGAPGTRLRQGTGISVQQTAVVG